MANIDDYSYPHIEPIEYIDESLDKILARDDASKCSFRRVSTFPIVTEKDIGMKVYMTGVGNFQLLEVAPEPVWKQLSSDNRNPAFTDWVIDNYQPLSEVLSSLAKLSNISNALPYFDGPADLQTTPITPLGASLLGQSSPGEVREVLGLEGASTISLPIDGSYIKPGSLSIDKIDNNFKKNLGWTTGDVKLTYKRTADSGWILLNDGSIGNASSGATTRANADTYDLFMLMWEIPLCTIQTFAGVDTPKGNSAIEDWSANKRLVLPKVLGRALGVAGTGEGLDKRNLGQSSGDFQTFSVDNIPPHNHAGMKCYQSLCSYDKSHRMTAAWGSPSNAAGVDRVVARSSGGSVSWVSSASGPDFTTITTRDGARVSLEDGISPKQPFYNEQPTSYLNIMMKL